jgi:hypothetical protein
MIENINTIKGTLYAKDTRKVPNKKKPTEPDWEFMSIKVECKILIGDRSLTVIPELQLNKGVSFDEFHIGDPIEVDYFLTGKKISDTWFKTEAKVVHIGFLPLENGQIRTPRKAVDSTFVAPNPVKEYEDMNEIDLPF